MKHLILSLCVSLLTTFVALPVASAEEGFTPLHTDNDASGWDKGVKVKDGLVSGGGRYLTKQYADFVLRFEFRLKAGSNSGIGIRAARSGNAAYDGMELQVLDNSAEKYKKLKEWQYHGSIYGVVAAKRGAQKPVGEWNSEEVIAKGNHIVVKVNGQVIVDVDIAEVSKDGTIDGKKHPGLLRKEGYLGILGHGGGVEFRKMRIKDLK
jgi:hypothetical protein